MGFNGGGGDNHRANHHHFSFHVHHHHDKSHGNCKDIPKGCMAVMVGTEEEQQQRFVIPVMYINHPLFMQLLKEAEEEYGFDQKGPITIPCHVELFRTVQGKINEEISSSSVHGGGHHHHHHHHHHILCFRV